jgi:hypothetical protein
MVARRMPGHPCVLALCAAALAVAGTACGDERQDAGAPSGEFGLDVTAASFPATQQVAEPATLRLRVRNTGDRAVPDLTVTVETAPGDGGAPVAFAQSVDDPALASPARPVWIVDEGPVGGDSAYTNTWAVGPLAAGKARTVKWRLTAVRAGRYTVAWRLAPALEGNVSVRGERTRGRFDVTIADAPVPARVNGKGEVVRERVEGR